MLEDHFSRSYTPPADATPDDRRLFALLLDSMNGLPPGARASIDQTYKQCGWHKDAVWVTAKTHAAELGGRLPEYRWHPGAVGAAVVHLLETEDRADVIRLLTPTQRAVYADAIAMAFHTGLLAAKLSVRSAVQYASGVRTTLREHPPLDDGKDAFYAWLGTKYSDVAYLARYSAFQRFWAWLEGKTVIAGRVSTKDPLRSVFWQWLQQAKGYRGTSAARYARLMCDLHKQAAADTQLSTLLAGDQDGARRICWDLLQDWAAEQGHTLPVVDDVNMPRDVQSAIGEMCRKWSPEALCALRWCDLTVEAEGRMVSAKVPWRPTRKLPELFLAHMPHLNTLWVYAAPTGMDAQTPLVPSTAGGVYPIAITEMRRILKRIDVTPVKKEG